MSAQGSFFISFTFFDRSWSQRPWQELSLFIWQLKSHMYLKLKSHNPDKKRPTYSQSLWLLQSLTIFKVQMNHLTYILCLTHQTESLFSQTKSVTLCSGAPLPYIKKSPQIQHTKLFCGCWTSCSETSQQDVGVWQQEKKIHIGEAGQFWLAVTPESRLKKKVENTYCPKYLCMITGIVRLFWKFPLCAT